MTQTNDELLAVIREVLTQADLPAEPFDPADGVLGFASNFDPTGLTGLLVYLFPDISQFACYLTRLDPLPTDSLAKVMALTTRLNNRIVVGNYEMDLDERTLRFKVGVDYTGVEVTPALVRNALFVTLDTYGDFSAAIEAVAAGEQTVPQALAALDADD